MISCHSTFLQRSLGTTPETEAKRRGVSCCKILMITIPFMQLGQKTAEKPEIRAATKFTDICGLKYDVMTLWHAILWKPKKKTWHQVPKISIRIIPNNCNCHKEVNMGDWFELVKCVFLHPYGMDVWHWSSNLLLFCWWLSPVRTWIVVLSSWYQATCWVYRGGLPGILTFGVGWGGVGMIPFLAIAHISVLRNWCFFHLHTSRCYATDVSALAHISMLRNWCFLHLHTCRCYATDASFTCTHLDATQLMFLALAHISMLRNWCSLQLHTSRCYATDASFTCTHLDATQLMFLALAHISVLRNWCFSHLHTSRCYAYWCFLHLHTSRCYATDVSCTCTHVDATQLMFLARAHIWVLCNWCSLHVHTSRCYATDVLCNCTHLGARQLMFLALAHISMLRNWSFPQQDAPSQTPPDSMHGKSCQMDTL